MPSPCDYGEEGKKAQHPAKGPNVWLSLATGRTIAMLTAAAQGL